MRGTYSPSVTFTGVRIPKDAALGRARRRPPGRRRRELRARLRRRLRRHRRGRARVRARLRQEARREAGEHRGRPGPRPCSATSGSCRAHLDAARLVLARRRRPLGAGRRGRARQSRQPREVSGHRGRPGGHVRVIQVVGGRGAYRDFPAGARVPRRPHVDPDAADDGPHAGGHRQERAGHRGGMFKSQANNPERAAARQLQGYWPETLNITPSIPRALCSRSQANNPATAARRLAPGYWPETLNIPPSRPSALLPMASSMRSIVGGISVEVRTSRKARSGGKSL